MAAKTTLQSDTPCATPDIDGAGVDRQQIRNFLALPVAEWLEWLEWLEEYASAMLKLRKRNPNLGRF